MQCLLSSSGRVGAPCWVASPSADAIRGGRPVLSPPGTSGPHAHVWGKGRERATKGPATPPGISAIQVPWRKPRRNRRRGRTGGAMGGAESEPAGPGKLLVLGGTGFLGQKVCQLALQLGYEVVSISRRGTPTEGSIPGVIWVKGNLVKDPGCLAKVLAEHKFVGVVHAIGMLFDNDLNTLVSGSGSAVDPGTTYDQVTRQTAVSALDALAAAREKDGEGAGPAMPFVFVSAAEAAWPDNLPFIPGFLKDYLAAKRAVEGALMGPYAVQGVVRPVMMRPSLMWTPDRPQAMPPVAAFYVANTLGFPGVDRPVRVETVAKAALHAIEDSTVRGAQDFNSMESLADECERSSAGRFLA